MNTHIQQLTELLLAENKHLTYTQARVWVEWIWEDFEATYAKAGQYHGELMSKKFVKQFIQQYGRFLHETNLSIANPPVDRFTEEDDQPVH
jgi:hypothetical protein